MQISKSIIIAISILLLLALWFAPPFAGLSSDAQHALALSLFAILWWVFKIVPAAYTSLLLIAGFLLFRLAEPQVVLTLWTRPLVWLIISSFLLAAAVSKSGLARRIAILLLSRFANDYRRTVLLIYVLGLLLSFLIPQPFPRALLMMAVVRQMIQAAGCTRRVAVSLGFAVFSSLTATSMFLLTGDVLLNLSAIEFSGQTVGWLQWLWYMAVPALAASALLFGLHLLVFGRLSFQPDAQLMRQELEGMGGLLQKEKVTLFWIAAALLLWVLDSVTHVDPAWVAVGAVVGLALPVVGEVLDVEDITTGISWPVIVFISGAFAIGAVSSATGLSTWLAGALLPAAPPENPFAFAALISAATMGVHMLVGSALATMAVITPTMSQYAAAAGWTPLFPALLIYTVVQIHYLLPFHHVTILVGEGEVGGYGNAETLRFGLPLTLVAWFVVLAVEVPWWRLIGLI